MKRLMALSFAAMASLAVAACGLGADDEQWANASQNGANPLIYEITNSGGEIEGWMLGTIHALPDGVSWRNDAADAVIAQADLLLVEVAELDNQSEIAFTFGELASTRGLGPLSNRVSPELRKPLAKIVARSDFPGGDFADTESWAAAIILARVDAVGEPRNGVDRALIRDFSDRDVRGFETVAGQLGVFDTLDAADQRDLLEGTVREWVEAQEQPGRLLRAWLAGDEATLIEATTSGIMADPELREALLVGRNEDWIDPLVETLETPERPLVAVGTAHLIGPDGLGAMLEKRGYSVRLMR